MKTERGRKKINENGECTCNHHFESIPHVGEDLVLSETGPHAHSSLFQLLQLGDFKVLGNVSHPSSRPTIDLCWGKTRWDQDEFLLWTFLPPSQQFLNPWLPSEPLPTGPETLFTVRQRWHDPRMWGQSWLHGGSNPIICIRGEDGHLIDWRIDVSTTTKSSEVFPFSVW